MKKILIFILLLIAILALGLIIFRNTLIKNGIEKSVKKIVQQEIAIDSISAGLLTTNLAIENLKVYNPIGYTEKLLLESQEIYIDYVLKDIIKGFLHFPSVRLNIKQVNVEKDKNGILNIDHFKPARKEGDSKEAEKEIGKEKKFLINKLILNIDTIRYQDNTKTPSTKKEFNVNISKTFTDVNSANVIVSTIIQGVTEKLIAEGISMTVNAFMKDEEFQKALKSGDVETMKKEGKGILSGLKKQFEGSKSGD